MWAVDVFCHNSQEGKNGNPPASNCCSNTVSAAYLSQPIVNETTTWALRQFTVI